MARRTIVGLRSDHEPGSVQAEERDGRVRFAALLRSGARQGEIVQIDTPVLTPAQIVALVKARMEAFMASHGARESPEAAVVRKAVAAQGAASVARARHQLDAMGKMELAMMLSKDSHTQALPLEQATGAPVVRMNARGEVRGLEPTVLVDSARRRYRT